jgi:hypothetical protein
LNKIEQVLIGILISFVVCFKNNVGDEKEIFWRNFCALAILLIAFNRNASAIDTEYRTARIETEKFGVRTFLKFFEANSKLLVATAGLASICFYSISGPSMPPITFFFYAIVSTSSLLLFSLLNVLIAKVMLGKMPLNRALALLTFVPAIVVLMIYYSTGIAELMLLVPGNANLVFFSKSPFYWLLPFPFVIVQYFVVKYGSKQMLTD